MAIFVEYVCYKTVNGYHVCLRRHRSTKWNSSFSLLVSTEFSEGKMLTSNRILLRWVT